MTEVLPRPPGIARAGPTLLMLVFLAGCQALPQPRGGALAGAVRSIDLPAPEGGSRTVMLADLDGRAVLSDGEQRLSLPVAAAHVLHLGPVPAEVGNALSDAADAQVALSGPYHAGQFQPDSLELVEDRPPRPLAGTPLFAPLLPRLEASTWGAEARARLSGSTRHGLALDCDAGQAPAGLQLQGPLAGLLERGRLALRMRLRGGSGFSLLVADGMRDDAQDPLPVAALLAGGDWQQQDVALPGGGWQAADWRSMTVACPQGAGRLEIEAMELVFAERPPSPGARALWVWSPAAWRDDAEGLLAHVTASQAHEVFVTVPLADEKCTGAACEVGSPAALARFLVAATRADVQVWAVAGDPRAVLPEERDAWTGRAAAYARFNQAQAADARLAGIQYDVEAYLVPGYGQDPAGWNRRYLELLGALRAAGGGLPLDAVVPWWFGQGSASPPELLDSLATTVDRLTVMDYRTDTTQLVQSALPFLAWGQRHQRGVRVAVEYGPLPDLEWRSYVRADRGELWLVDLDQRRLYVLLDAAVDAEAPAQVFAARGGHLVKAAQTTFHDRPDALWRTVSRLEDAFGAAQAFSGVAIHGLDHAWY